MAVPKGKVSKARRNKRRANWKLSVPNMVECPQCHEFKMPHKVCKSCGYYNGKEVIKKVEDKLKENVYDILFFVCILMILLYDFRYIKKHFFLFIVHCI